MPSGVKLYSLSLSHPAQAARLMLERKGIEHRVVDLPPGLHPPLLHAAGFRGGTVPALRIDGRRVQGSRQIAAALEQLQPHPALFPADPERRRAVAEAEAWGERELQPVPRRIFRWGATRSQELRRWAAVVVGMPAPGVMAAANQPVAWIMGRKVGADTDAVRADVEATPGLLDTVDELIAAGTIGGPEPNAADYQIGTTVRVLLAYQDLRPIVEGRPAAELAVRVLPSYPERIPAFLPEEWLDAVRAEGVSRSDRPA